MITYNKEAYGLNLLLRLHGSAVYKAFVPGIISVGFYALVNYLYAEYGDEQDDMDHPYVIGVLVTSVSFLIIFRANNSYHRYWEACGAVHHMMSKFLDATVHMASFHMQCVHYNEIKPPSFFKYPELVKYNLNRDRGDPLANLKMDNDNFTEIEKRRAISINHLEETFTKQMQGTKKGVHFSRPQDADNAQYGFKGATSLKGPGRTDGNWNAVLELDSLKEYDELNFERRNASNDFGDTPSLFLQELAHLSSLLIAVAFSTLRNNIEGTEAPLGTYVPGQEWPSPDPDHLANDEHGSIENIWQSLYYWIGMDRTPAYKAKYYTTRPMLVLGGVSESEIRQLQKARGASAKTTLAWYWLSEFIGREHLAGSSGNIGPPIISRLFQFLSDGMIYYNHGRKIMFIPFPFPHAQISAVFIVVMIVAVPFMMHQYANEKWLGSILTFLLVVCLSGLHEVARELENPYRNIPNEIPLCTLLAQYNEALISMCSGYHPDAFWADEVDRQTINRYNGTNGNRRNREKKAEENKISEMSALKLTIEKQSIEIEKLAKVVSSLPTAIPS